MSSGKGGTLKSAQDTGTQALQNAQAFNTQQQQQLGGQVAAAQQNVGAIGPQVQGAITGALSPSSPANQQFTNAGAIGQGLGQTKALTPTVNPTVNTGYTQMAQTGGITPEQGQAQIRSATRAAGAGYAANQDQLNRRLAVQGGYMPGFTSSQQALTRQGASAGAEAATGAQVALHKQIQAGKEAGLSGLQGMTAQQQAAAQAAENARLSGTAAGGQILNQGAIGRGQVNQAAINSLINYYQSNVNQMTDAEKLQIENQLALNGMTKVQIDALLGKAAQQPSTLQNISSIGQLAGSLATTGAMIAP